MSHVLLAMLLTLASITAGAAPAQAGDSTPTGASSAANTPSTQAATGSKPRKYVTANASGLPVVLDRETGATRALTAEEAQYLAQGIKELLSQETDGLVQIQRADGTVSMDLQGRFQSVMLARKEDDGGISQACVDNAADAAAFFEIDPVLLKSAQRTVSQPPAQLDIR